MKTAASAARIVRVLAWLTIMAAANVVGAADGGTGHAHGSGGGSADAGPAGVTSLDVYSECDRLHLLLAVRQPGKPRELQYVRSDDGGASWSRPRPLGEGQPPPEIARRGMDVQIAAAGDHLVAAWTAHGDANRFGRGPIATALSSDGGKTWRAGPNPADDAADSDHAFIDIAADDAGTFHLTWLDARGGSKGLLYARSTDGGSTWSKNVVVKPETCECCWNTIRTARGGKVFILFRDKNPRDMALVASHDGGKTWGKPVPVGCFEWDFGGCPHVGGGLATGGSTTNRDLHAVVWTAKPGLAGTYALASSDAGATWSDPLKLDATASHPDVACGGGGGEVAAVWDAFIDGGTSVFAATSNHGGKSWSEPRRLSELGASATHPRIVRTSLGFLVFWTEHHGGKGAAWAVRKLDH
jgi:hypothetical protein